MDPNQTTGTAPSTVNDINLVGPDSETGVIPTGLAGTNDATQTAPTQQIPPIETSSQDRSLPINQTSISERAGARVWNRPGDRPSSNDLTRSQSRLISPTPLAQTRGELTELRGMMTTLIDKIRSQRIANQSNANRLDPSRKGARRASSCKHSRKTSNTPRSVKSDVQPSKRWTVRYSGDPKRSIWALHGRNSQRPSPQGITHRSLSYSGLDQINTGLPTPTKHSDPIPERINEKAGGAKDTDPTTEPLYLRESNSIHDENLPSSRI